MNDNNILDVLSARILTLRMQHELTQSALAEQLGISFQAVSKWETGQSAPDITLLPQLAEIFGVQIDALFGREPVAAAQDDSETEPSSAGSAARYVIDNVPWEDDDVIRGVVYQGKTLLEKVDRLTSKFVFVYEGEAVNVSALCSLECGDVRGEAHAGMGLTCRDVTGNVHAGMNITCGDVEGYAHAQMNIQKCGDVGGHATAGMNLNCGDVQGTAGAGMNLRFGKRPR